MIVNFLIFVKIENREEELNGSILYITIFFKDFPFFVLADTTLTEIAEVVWNEF